MEYKSKAQESQMDLQKQFQAAKKVCHVFTSLCLKKSAFHCSAACCVICPLCSYDTVLQFFRTFTVNYRHSFVQTNCAHNVAVNNCSGFSLPYLAIIGKGKGTWIYIAP